MFLQPGGETRQEGFGLVEKTKERGGDVRGTMKKNGRSKRQKGLVSGPLELCAMLLKLTKNIKKCYLR